MARIQVSNDSSGRIIVSFPYDSLLVEKVNPAVALEGQLGAPPTLYPAVHNCWIYQAVFYPAPRKSHPGDGDEGWKNCFPSKNPPLWAGCGVCYALCNGWVKTIDGRRWHPAEKHWSFQKLDDALDKIVGLFENEDVQVDPSLKAAASKTKDTPSPLGGEGKGEGYNFEDLRGELVSRKFSYKTVKGYIYYNFEGGDIDKI